MTTILVIDDNRDAADMLAALLTLKGHQVRLAYSGQDAIAMIADAPPAVVVSDLNMPGIDGYEVARIVRAASGIKQPQMIAYSGCTHEASRRLSAQSGFDAHLSKTSPIATLLATIASVD